MSSVLGHSLAGMSLWALSRRLPALQPLEHRAWLAAASVAACLPDLDALLGLPHRGPTHTAGFALAIGAIAGLGAASRNLKKEAPWIATVFALIVWSHPALDLLTGGGPDVALFRPFWAREFAPLPGGLPLTAYTSEWGGLFGILFNPWTIWAMMVETAIFGSLFAATITRHRYLQVALPPIAGAVWILLAVVAAK
jgi:membrane-bound metal-dependent hydrolase YbcI (DUF457 family)